MEPLSVRRQHAVVVLGSWGENMCDILSVTQAKAVKESALFWKMNKGMGKLRLRLTGVQKCKKDVFASRPPPKPCHSACVSTALAQLTKSISLRVCERVMRSVWVCEGRTGEVSISVCVQVRELFPRRDVPFPPINYWGIRTHWELRWVTGQETRTPAGFQRASVSLFPSTRTHTHTHMAPKKPRHTVHKEVNWWKLVFSTNIKM